MRLVKLVDGELIALGATVVQNIPLKNFFQEDSYQPGSRLIFETDEALAEFMKMRSKTFRTIILLMIYQAVASSDNQFIIGTVEQLLNRYKRVGLLAADWNPQGSAEQILAQTDKHIHVEDRTKNLPGLAKYVVDYQLAIIQQATSKIREFSGRYSQFALAEGLDQVGKIGLVNSPHRLENLPLDYWEVSNAAFGNEAFWWVDNQEVTWWGREGHTDRCFAVELPQFLYAPQVQLSNPQHGIQALVQRTMPLDLVSAVMN